MRPTPLLVTALGALTLPFVIASGCNDGGRDDQFFGPGSTGAMQSSGTMPGPGPGPGGPVGAFSPTGNMTTGRFRHTATLLGDGRVLVVGGWGQPPAFNEQPSSELWSPTTGMWQSTDSIATPASAGFMQIGLNQTARVDHAAVLLPNPGNPAAAPVLIIGGMGQERFLGTTPAVPYESLFSVFLFNPVAGPTFGFTQQASLNSPRRGPLASVLPNGQVLVTGGQDQTFMPGSGNPQVPPPPTIGNTLTSSELYNPANNTWTVTSATNGLHSYGLAFAAGNQINLVVNGANIQSTQTGFFFLAGPGASPSTEVFNGTTWTNGPTTTGNRVFFGGSLDTANGGRVFVAGGIDPNMVTLNGGTEFFNPTTNTWTMGPMLMNPRAFHQVTEIGGNAAAGTGDMLISGGESGTVNGPQTAICEVYGTLTNSILGTVNMATAREDHRAVRLSDGRILVTGGFNAMPAPGVSLNSCEIHQR